MAIIQATSSITGLVGVQPNIIFLNTTDSLATVTTVGYLTRAVKEELIQISVPTAQNPGGTIAFVNTATGPVILMVVVTGIAPNLIYSLVEPTFSGNAIFAGDVQAGLNGIAGGFISYPAAALSGHMTFFATAQGGNFTSTITNAAFGQATALTIPDPGNATASFLLTKSAGTQTIATGNLALTLGTLTLGSSGHASSLTLFPATAGNGTFIILPLNAGGAFNTTIRNSVLGQSTVFSIPDPGAATANFILSASGGTQTITTGNLSLTVGTLVVGSSITSGINNSSAGFFVAIPAGNNQGSFRFIPVANTGNFTTSILNRNIGQATAYSLPDAANANASILVGATITPFVTNHSLVASGTGGLIADAGYQLKTVAGAGVAGGAAAQTIVDAFCTAASNIVGNWNTQTNPASILTITPGVGSFVVTSSADPGLSTFNYIITKTT